MTNPEMMHLISEIPEPAACLAKECTRRAATKDNAAFWVDPVSQYSPKKTRARKWCVEGWEGKKEREMVPHRKQHVYEPTRN